MRIHGVDVGERVRVRLHERFGRIKAEVLEVLKPSTRRIASDCPSAQHCPGCSLRHLSPADEANHKVEARKSRLERAGRAVQRWDRVFASKRTAVRSRAVARAFTDHSGQLQLGMRAWTGDEIVDLATCPIQTEGCRALLELTAGELRKLGIQSFDLDDRSGDLRHVIVEAYDGHSDQPNAHSRVILAFGRPESATLIPPHFMADHPDVVVAIDILPFRDAGLISKPQPLQGDGCIYPYIDQETFRVSLGAWAPQTPSSVGPLRKTIVEWLDPNPKDRIIEVGCGVGPLSIGLSRYCEHLTGIDMSRSAVSDAQFNATQAGIENLTFITGRAEHSLRKLAARSTPCDLALVHAMRSPMGEKAMMGLNALAPRKILYLAPQLNY